MRVSPLKLAFESFAQAPHSAVEAALLVSRVVNPATDTAWCRAELERLAQAAGPTSSVPELVAALSAQGFTGAEDYYAPQNSSLEYVLRQRQGIPITLAIVLIGIGEHLRMRSTGINFPGHFLVSLNETLVDPYTLRLLDAAECRARVAASGVPYQQAMRTANPLEIALRMLNNLRGLAQSRDDFHAALEMTEYQLILAPQILDIRLARADLWQVVGAPDLSRHELETALALAPSAALSAEIRERLAAIQSTGPTLH